MNIFENIELNRPNFTKSELKVAEYILKNPQMVEEMTVSRVADFATSSKSAVLRFCQKLGYSGYSEFRFNFIHSLHLNTNNLEENTSLLNTYTSLFSSACLDMANLSEETLLEVVKMIYNSPVIRTVGILKSMLPAMKFYYDFTSLGKNVLPITDNVMPGRISSVSSKDLILYFSVSGRFNSSSMKDFIELAQERNCDIILVTCNPKGQIVKYASKVILLSTLQLSADATIDEHALMLMLIDILAGYYKTELLS